MNELQRQHYLSALGVDTYMPRWHLPFAPIAVRCELPVAEIEIAAFDKSAAQSHQLAAPIYAQPIANSANPPLSSVHNVIGDILNNPAPLKPATAPISAKDILAQLDAKPIVIDPFSLSIWRPLDGLIIIDSRNTKLALPTELLLHNILRAIFSSQAITPQEEVLRWPMIENSFAKRTKSDACTELQTWLSVQHEIRPIQSLWVMGSNAATYLMPESVDYAPSVYKSIALLGGSINALILPSLNDVLQKPSAKQLLFSALRDYHSAQQ